MQVKETCVARGASPFIMKADTSPILSPITKARVSPFMMKAGTSPIPYIERHALKWHVYVSYPPYKSVFPARAEQLRCPILPCSYHLFPFFGGAPLKTLR
jgi:hypothetical protein